jgi:isopenicillin N synthase-like dioxygenase
MSSTDDVPTIDISRFTHGSSEERNAVISQISDACERIGFFLVKGHGVPDSLIQRAYNSAQAFFDLPKEEKLNVKRNRAEVSRGYNLLADQSLSRSLGILAPPDLQESFNIGPVNGDDGAYFTEGFGAIHFAPNRWPARPANFRHNATDYYLAMEIVARRLMRIFALALGLEEAFFDRKIDKHVSSLRFINYPDQPMPPADGQKRAGEHTDYGALTILKVEDAPGGLQVRDRAGNWVDIGYVPETFVVNIGDLMMQWTNDRWISTLHRVMNPPRDAALGSRRISLVFFHQPNYDAEVACLPTCVSAEKPAKYPPTTSGAHWRAKNQAARSVKPSAEKVA